MRHSFVAEKNGSIVRIEYISESWGDIKNIEIITKGETPTLRYDFVENAVKMSSGEYTKNLPSLVETMEKLAKNIQHYNDIVTIFTDERWEVIAEKS